MRSLYSRTGITRQEEETIFSWIAAAYDKLDSPLVIAVDNFSKFEANRSALAFFMSSSVEKLGEILLPTLRDAVLRATTGREDAHFDDSLRIPVTIERPDGAHSHFLRGVSFSRLGPDGWLFALADDHAALQRSTYVYEVDEEIRIGLARELHDNLGQEITVLRLAVNKLQRELANVDTQSCGWVQQLAMVSEQVEAVSKAGRRMAFDFRSDVVTARGLAFAVSELVLSLRKRIEISGSLEVSTGWTEPNAVLANHVYRSIQEMLNNIAKHSRATKFKVKLYRDENNACCVEVADNGVGVHSERIQTPLINNMGIRSLRERASLYGGVVRIQTRPVVEGFHVFMSLPDKQVETTEEA